MLLTPLQPQEHPLLEDRYTRLEGTLHLTEQALQYLCSQEPAFLRDMAGPAFARQWAHLHTSQVCKEQEDMHTRPRVFSLSLVHHHTSLTPGEIAKLEHFVLRMPEQLCHFKPDVYEGLRVASCCWLRGLHGCLPLYWQVEHICTFHRELPCATG